MAAKLAIAVALVDLAVHGVKAGHLLEASASTIKALETDGSVDTAKPALDHAARRGIKPVRSAWELAEAAAAQQAMRTGLEADIQALEASIAMVTNADAKAALEKDLQAKREQLAALG